ncbi:MAG: hypothetical protein QOG62_2652 [Thermoleophilaceae bacterium]|nr:hypothetical protein [Thermoleophilaceae bacterium]
MRSAFAHQGRILAVTALLFAATAAPAQATGDQPSTPRTPRVLIAFLPQAFLEAPGIPLLPEFGRLPGAALGLTSPALGAYYRQQVLLDISSGSRISTRTYPEDLGPLFLRHTGKTGRTAGWAAAVQRGRDGPGEIRPGLLTSTIEEHGGRVAYAGVAGGLQGESVVATDEDGQIERVSIAGKASLAPRALGLMQDYNLVVARLPRGKPGLHALETILAQRQPRDMVYVMVAPTLSFGLLPTAVASAGFYGLLRSPTTRRPGLVTATDIAPTVLHHLGMPIPQAMQGQPVSYVPDLHPEATLQDLNDRQEAVTDRRVPALALTLGAWLLIMAGLWLARRGQGVRLGVRIGFLALLWIPTMALLTAALEPSAPVEYAIVGLGSLGLGALCDRLLPWPGAPVLPAVILLVFHTIDLALNSPLIVASMAGPTPRGGARFFGIGNELETILSVTVLLGMGAFLAQKPIRRASLAFGVSALIVAVIMGAGRLGADVGGVITLGAGGAVAVVASLVGGPTRKAIVLAVLAPFAGIALLVVVDLVTGGNAHFTRFILDAHGTGELLDTAQRRLDLAGSILLSGTTPISLAVFAGAIGYGLWRRKEFFAPLVKAVGERRAQLFAAGVYGTIAALVIGSIANDSGPRIFLVGSVAAMLGAGYGWAVPDTIASADGQPGNS